MRDRKKSHFGTFSEAPSLNKILRSRSVLAAKRHNSARINCISFRLDRNRNTVYFLAVWWKIKLKRPLVVELSLSYRKSDKLSPVTSETAHTYAYCITRPKYRPVKSPYFLYFYSKSRSLKRTMMADSGSEVEILSCLRMRNDANGDQCYGSNDGRRVDIGDCNESAEAYSWHVSMW